eukprot:TRINITY_DN27363_c0_g2_i1.p1 TRINITY_DN27363_c0_g2~~TRINITY_DN27363_c0_g2_i1.p1  ORF type:complete len:1273 (+),score=213.54 TRINITY_DN27363_c0_g2_i1:72-3821(+)
MERLSYRQWGNDKELSELRKRPLSSGRRHGDFEEEYSEYSSLGGQSTREPESLSHQRSTVFLPDAEQEEMQSMAHSVKTLFPVESPYWLAPGGLGNPDANPHRVCVDDLQEAALRGDVQLLLRQIQEGVPVNAPLSVIGGDEFLTLLHMLACKPDVPNGAQIVCELMDAKANPNVRSTLGSTPLMFACYHKNVTVAKILLEADANPDAADDHGITACRYAVMLDKDSSELQNQQAASVNLLVTLQLHGANLDYGGDRPTITEAVIQDNCPAVTQLLQLGFEPLGLVEAITDKTVAAINELLAARANPFHENEEGLDCMELAIRRGDEDILHALRYHIADLERARHVHLNTKMKAIEHREQKKTKTITRRSRFYEPDFDHTSTLKHKFFNMEEQPKPIEGCVKSYQRRVQRMLKHPILSWTLTINLILALFLPDTWVILGMDSDSLNYALCVILGIFVLEFGMQVFAFWTEYLWKFVFWTDIIGLLSVPLDITWIMHEIVGGFDAANEVHGAGVARVTKFVKLGARAGRLSRLVKLLRFIPGLKSERPGAERLVTPKQKGTAKGISLELSTKLAMKVAIIIIMAVIVIPVLEFWRFPLDDNSQTLWAGLIGDMAERYPEDVEIVIQDMITFYQNKNYFPYQVTYAYRNGTIFTKSIEGASVPLRSEDIACVSGKHSHSEILFNFRSPNFVEASVTVIMMSTIICIIFIAAGTVSTTVASLVSTPIAALLEKVQTVAQQIFEAVEMLATYFVKDHANTNFSAPAPKHDDSDPIFAKEIAFLSKVVQIIGVLHQISAAKRPIDEFEQLGNQQKKLLRDFATAESKRHDSSIDRLDDQLQKEKLEEPSLMESIALEIEEADMARTDFDNWELNTIEMSSTQRTALAHCVIMMYDTTPGFDHKVVDIQRYSCHGEFVKAVENSYDDEHVVPYHNWIHAVDVAFTLRNIFRLMHAEKYFNLHERYALMVAALAHDLGHLGTTNAYLIDSQHELALMYNDSSCRENMSAAKLFEMTRRPESAIFVHIGPKIFKEVREIIVSAILYTDMAKHFSLMRQLRMHYIQKEDLFQYISARSQADEPIPETACKELEDFFWNSDVKYTLRNILVHFADLSNSLKPWEQCFGWAQLMYEEFFKQGDQEREYKLMMQPLNDRVRVNMPLSQIKYIIYFVAPQTCLLGGMMPGLLSFQEYLWPNTTHWLEKWQSGGVDPDELHELTREVAIMKENSYDAPFIIDRVLSKSRPLADRDEPRMSAAF